MGTWQSVRERILRLTGLARRHEKESEMNEELQFHLAMRQAKYAKSGDVDDADAAVQARRDLGNLEKWKEECRDVDRPRWIEDFGSDLALAVRMLRKSPAFTAVAFITLASAIGANTAIFSLMNAILLRPLPVPEADRLTMLRVQPDDFGYAFSYPIFSNIEKYGSVFSQVFAFAGRNLQVRSASGTDRIAGQLVSGAYFPALQVRPRLGRYLLPRDDQPGTASGEVAVISGRFWRERFGSDPRVLGRKIVLNNVALTIVGVMPESFRGANKDDRPDVFLPFELEPMIDAPFNNIAAGFGAWWFQAGARLADGVSLEKANAFLRASSGNIMKGPGGDPNFGFLNGHKLSELFVVAEPGATGYSFLRLRFRKPLRVLMTLVVLVLLIACMNLATLLMARTTAREREIATRFALGANRLRLLRQLLTESLLLATVGAALGLAAAPLLANLLAGFLTSQQNTLLPKLDVAPDVRVFAFTAAVAIVATVLTGIAPALRSTRRDLQVRMRESGAALRGSNRSRFWPRLLLAFEVSLALVLVTGASLLGFSLVKLHQLPLGFEPRGLVFLELEMQKQSRNGQAMFRAYHDIADRLRGLPNVKAVGFVDNVPLMGNWGTASVSIPGQGSHELYRMQAGPDYFRAMHTQLLAGREFQWSDTKTSGPVVILNRSAARVLFPKERSPLGQTVTFDGKTLLQIAGIVADAKYQGMREAAPPIVYSPMTQDTSVRPSYTAVLRVNGSPSAAISAAGNLIRKIVPEIPSPVAMTMEQTIAESLSAERMMATLALFFGALALLITGIGLYGTLAYTTQRRTGEIGIRLALGAQRKNVLSMVCRENIGIALGGCIVGAALSVAGLKMIASFLFETSLYNPAILSGSALLMVTIAAGASLLPAIRASRIDPIAAIRHE
ncbi:MAG: ABC transporter permease [Acidobacteriota bacterium]|nr:ABC transporter permease [Acidobacteriota bacterium]